MGPSNENRQGRLPFDARKPVAHVPPWMPSNTPEHQDALRMIRQERARLEDQRARTIEHWCDHFREGGSEIRLETPRSDPRLHLFANGVCMGVFVTRANGETDFCQTRGEA